MSDVDFLNRAVVERALGDRRRNDALMLARRLGLDTRRFHRDRDLAVAIVEAARRQRQAVRL